MSGGISGVGLSAGTASNCTQSFEQISGKHPYFYKGLIENFLAQSDPESVGIGGYGEVFEHPHLYGKWYAIKKYKTTDDDNARIQKSEKLGGREGNIGTSLLHRNIVKVHAYVKYGDTRYLIMDFADGIDITDSIVAEYFSFADESIREDRVEVLLREGNIRFLMKELVEAVHYLHKNNVLYRDIKGDNILCEFNKKRILKRVKLVDLGHTRSTQTESGLLPKNQSGVYLRKNFSYCGSLVTMSPEVLSQNGDYSEKTDCWGLGSLLYYLCTMTYPFEDEGDDMLESRTKSGKYKMHSWIPVQAQDLIRRLLILNPEDRLSTEQILTHRFLQ